MNWRESKSEKIITGIVLVALFVLSYLVFKRQADGKFVYSDVVLHIEYALKGEEMYSITPLTIRAAYNAAGSRGVSLLFSTLVILTVFTTAMLLRECVNFYEDKTTPDFGQALLISVPFLFLTGIYIPHYFEIYYLSKDFSNLGSPFSICAQPWHNSTYLMMRLFAPLVLFMYFRIEKKLKDKCSIRIWEWVVMTVFLLLTNASKPNFYLTFAPVVFIFVLYDFIRSRGGTLKTALCYGAVLLCSAGVLVFQWIMMYGEGASHESGIVITGERLKALIEAGNLIPMLVSGLLFAIVATVICLVKGDNARIFVFIWLMFFISFCQVLFLRETGIRENDMNFNWGMLFASYFLNLVCISRLIALKDKIGKTLFAVSMLPLFFMVCTGVRYFYLLMTGDTFII